MTLMLHEKDNGDLFKYTLIQCAVFVQKVRADHVVLDYMVLERTTFSPCHQQQ